MKDQITLKQLAKLAGTSLSTVSKALNNSDEISKATKLQIQKLARQHHYQPNQIARSLRAQKTNTIGMLIPDSANLYYAGLLKGAEDVARANGYSIVIGNTDEEEKLERRQINIMLGLRVSGILSAPISEGQYHALGVPYVFLSRCRLDQPARRYNYAINDDLKGAFLAAEHLIRQGKRNLFFICGPEKISVAEQRTEGFRRALEKYGIEFKRENVLYGNITTGQGHEALLAIAKEHAPPFGVFCSSDNLAIGALAAAREQGLSIPEDVGLVGYDDIETLKYLDFPLTTVRQDIYQIGARGAGILLNILSGGDAQSGRIVFEPELIVRAT